MVTTAIIYLMLVYSVITEPKLPTGKLPKMCVNIELSIKKFRRF